MKVPALYRKRRGAGGAYYGSYLAKIGGVEVALNTKNATIAYERLGEALRGKRDWPSDAELAARALEGGAETATGAALPGVTDRNSNSAPPVAVPAPAAAAPPIVPDAIEPPRLLPPVPPSSPAADARAEAEATNAAAAETAGAGAGEEAPPGLDFSADALEGMLLGAAEALVQAQLDLQAYVIERRTGKRPQPLPEQLDARLVAPLRTAAAKAWVAQFKRWFPDMTDVPPWILALGLPLLIAPIQVATAKPVEKQPEQPAAQAAA